MTIQPPLPSKWTQYLMDMYAGKQPVLGTVDIKEIEEKAREVMKGDPKSQAAFMFVFGSAGTGSTDAANRQAFEHWRIVPRMLVNATNRNLETTIFGVKYPVPLFVAPVGGQITMHAEGGLATARAAANVGVLFILNTASSHPMEDIATANGPNGHRWFQLYCTRTPDVTLSLLRRAKSSGFTALVITVDAMCENVRPHDLKTGFRHLFRGASAGNGTSDPVFMSRLGLQPLQTDGTPLTSEQAQLAAREWRREMGFGLFRTWDNLKFIKDNWDGPIVLKGILRPSDAEEAIVQGFDGIIVSTHGGRCIDDEIGSLDALDRIMCSSKVRQAQQSGKLVVLLDSGIRTGSDIIKALAMGAQAVLIGRPCLYGLAIAGQEGVEQILMQTICDLHITMGLAGYSDVHDLIGKKDEVLKRVDYGF